METFDSVLNWLGSGPGAVVLAAWLASWLLEDWQAWRELPSKVKKLWILGISGVLGIGAKVLFLRPGLTEAIAPYLDTFVLIVGAWLTTQVAHKADKATDERPITGLVLASKKADTERRIDRVK